MTLTRRVFFNGTEEAATPAFIFTVVRFFSDRTHRAGISCQMEMNEEFTTCKGSKGVSFVRECELFQATTQQKIKMVSTLPKKRGLKTTVITTARAGKWVQKTLQSENVFQVEWQ